MAVVNLRQMHVFHLAKPSLKQLKLEDVLAHANQPQLTVLEQARYTCVLRTTFLYSKPGNNR